MAATKSIFAHVVKVICLIALLLMFGLSEKAFGQGVTGRLLGSVQDPSQAAIPNAQVTITNQDTGLTWKHTTESNGNYVAPNLPPGSYRVEVEAPGFRKAISPNNVITVDQTTRVDIRMEVGTITQTVEVTAVAPLVRSTTSDMGEVVSDRQIHELPLNGRIFSQLVTISPGAIATGWGDEPESASGAGARSPITASVNGMPWQGTTYTLDGVSNMELMNAFMNVTPPLEAIQEVRVSTNNSSADIGTYGGAQVNAYIKSGTNDFHGSVFEFLRNDALNARRWEAVSKAPLRGNQFGGTLGGPIIKNKAFFFADFQGLRLRNGQSWQLTVPTQLMRQGIFLTSQFPDGIYDPQTGQPFPQVTTADGPAWQIPTDSFDSVSQQMVAGAEFWPLPNAAGLINNYNTNTTKQDTVNSFDAKVDYQFSNGDRLFVRESYQRRNLVAPSPGTKWLFTWDVNSQPKDHNAAIGYTHSFTPTLLNELRLGFNRFDTVDFGNDHGTNENTTLGIPYGNLPAFPESTGLAQFWIGDIWQTGSPDWTNAQRLANTYQLTENLNWTKGPHTFKFGMSYMQHQATLTNPDYNGSGAFFFDSNFTSDQGTGGDAFASFLLGLPSSLYRGVVNTRPATRSTLAGIYAQDDFRVTRNLTLNLALRWDVVTNPVDKYNRQSNFSLEDGLLHTAQPGNRGPNVDNYLGGVSPRVGIAYSPDNGKTAIRAAFGVTVFPDHWGAIGGTLERNFPFFEQFSRVRQQLYTPFTQVSVDGLPNFVPTEVTPTIVPPPATTVYYMPRDFRPDQANMWNFGIARQLTPTTALDVSYVGTKGTHLYRGRDINIPLPGPGDLDPRRPYYYLAPTITSISDRASDGNSIYNALQLKFTKSFSRGFQTLVSYTWSKDIDDLDMWVPFDNKLNRHVGTSNGIPDIPHNFIASYIYELPFGTGKQWLSSASRPAQWLAGGWRFSGITIVRAGRPLTMWVASSLLNNGLGNHPDVTCSKVGTPKFDSSVGFGVQWFDTSCFSEPAIYTLGNASPGLVRSPALANFDLSLFKSEKIGERVQIDIRADFFNAFNTPHFADPATTLGYSNFGVISGTTLTPREIQLGLKLSF